MKATVPMESKLGRSNRCQGWKSPKPNGASSPIHWAPSSSLLLRKRPLLDLQTTKTKFRNRENLDQQTYMVMILKSWITRTTLQPTATIWKACQALQWILIPSWTLLVILACKFLEDPLIHTQPTCLKLSRISRWAKFMANLVLWHPSKLRNRSNLRSLLGEITKIF